MYRDTITLFVRTQTAYGEAWIAKVLTGVDLNNDRAAIVRQYGETCTDNAKLHIKYHKNGENILIGNDIYVEPKEYDALSSVSGYITMHNGSDFDFWCCGAYYAENPISDDSYPHGFYNYMQSTRDDVHAVHSVSRFSVIPHFEVLGK